MKLVIYNRRWSTAPWRREIVATFFRVDGPSGPKRTRRGILREWLHRPNVRVRRRGKDYA